MTRLELRFGWLAPAAVSAMALAQWLTTIAAAPYPLPATGWLALALASFAAGLLTHELAARHPGWSGIVGGSVAGCWLAAGPETALIASHLAASASLAATAGLFAAARHLRGRARPVVAGAVAALSGVAVATDPRAWPIGLIAAASIGVGATGRVRWLALLPGLAGAIASAWLWQSATRDLSWIAPHLAVSAPIWLAHVTDRLGPIALATATLGLGLAIRARSYRHDAALLVAAAVALVPTSIPVPGAVMAAATMAVGLALTQVASRVGRPVHQLAAGGAFAAWLLAPFVIG